jgi:hypothetical protein
MRLLRCFAFCLIAIGLAVPAAADTGDDMKKLMPKPLAGWKQTTTVALKVGKGFRAAGEYRPPSGPHVINVTYQTESWDATSKRQLLADPEAAKKANHDIVDIGGRKWLATTGKGGAGPVQTLSTVLDNGLVVTITGFGEDRKAHEAYAKAIDVAALAKLK